MIVRRPSSQLTNTSSSSASSDSSRKSSLYPPSVLEVWDTDDEHSTMSADDYVPSRPLSVAIPAKSTSISGPYCPRRPNLREILSNTSPPPWTLAAFMAYLSSNHCLETLEFTMDAGRYKKHFAKMQSRAPEGGAPPSKDQDYVSQLWLRLIEAYIQPNGSREVNLPSDVRDPILNVPAASMPPAPEMLDRAVAKIYELMEESVLVPFLNSVYPQSALPIVSSCPVPAADGMARTKTVHEDRSRRHQRQVRSSPPPQSAVETHAHSYSHPLFLNRKSAPSTLTAGLKSSRYGTPRFNPTTSQPQVQTHSIDAISRHGSEVNLSGSGSNSGFGMTDDSGSTSSPTGDSPLTPPVSPHVSDLGSPHSSPRTSRDSGMWKKLGRLSGMKMNKKKSQGGLQTDQ